MLEFIASGLVGAAACALILRWLNSAPEGSLRKRMGVVILGGGGPGPPPPK